MELPERAQKLISEYAKPITKGDWRNGSKCGHVFKKSKYMTELYKMYLKYYLLSNEYTQTDYGLIIYYDNLSDLLKIYGEKIYNLSPYKPYIMYNNFYYILRYFLYLKYTVTPVYFIDEIIKHNYY